jgi:hypothetical protein
LSFRFFRVLTFSVSAAVFSVAACAQTAPAPQAPAAAPASPAAPTAPDYPEPRTFTFGLSYGFNGNSLGTQTGIFGGKTAPDFETIPNLGKPKNSEGFYASLPITRTGELKVEGFLYKGTGSQTVVGAPDPYDAGAPFTSGDYLATQYQIKNVKLYLDDLLFPHKFPVAKLRFKSLWGVEYVGIHNNEVSNQDVSPVIADNTSNLIYPILGLAMEYQLSKHVLVRLATDGFAFPHKAVLGEGEGSISYRRKSLEILAGEKYFHFKTSPNTTTYVKGTIVGAFVGVRWHFQ